MHNLIHAIYTNKHMRAQSGGNLLMLRSDTISAGRRFGLDGASIRFTLACLQKAAEEAEAALLEKNKQKVHTLSTIHTYIHAALAQ